MQSLSHGRRHVHRLEGVGRWPPWTASVSPALLLLLLFYRRGRPPVLPLVRARVGIHVQALEGPCATHKTNERGPLSLGSGS